MRVAFLSNKTARVSLPVLQKLVASPDLTLVHTFFYDTIAESRKSPREILAQYGARRLLAKIFGTLIGRFRLMVGKRLGTKRCRAQSSYELAVVAGLPHSTVADINAPETIARLQAMHIDALIVCVCKNILRHRLLALPDVHFVNIHPSLLPQYRGPTPTFWMLYNGEQETGVTFHEMTTNIDQGQILMQLSHPLDCRKSETQIEFEVFELAASAVEQVLQNIGSNLPGTTACTPDAEPSYYSFPTPSERRELKQRLTRGQNQPVS